MADPDNQILRSAIGDERNVARSLEELPVKKLIEDFATGIAEAQAAIDKKSAEAANQFAATTVPIGGKNYNLIELGFVPSFYYFIEAELTMKLTLSSSFGTELGVGFAGGVGSSIGEVSAPVQSDRKSDDPAKEGGTSPAKKNA